MVLCIDCTALQHQADRCSDVTIEIPYYNILDVSLDSSNDRLHLSYTIKPGKNHDLQVVESVYPLGDSKTQLDNVDFVAQLMRRAYGEVEPRRRIKVLINPFGGKGHAQYIYKTFICPVFSSAKCELDVVETTHSGHAQTVAEEINIQDFDVIACCSGDGLPHEVFNGLGKRRDARVALANIAVAQLPCGSGNAMCQNLYGTARPGEAALAVIKGHCTPLDLMSVTQGPERYLSFLSQSFGIIAEADLGTEYMRFIGSTRFTLGVAYHIIFKTSWPADVAFRLEADAKPEIRQKYNEYLRRGGPDDILQELRGSASWQNPASGLPELQFGTVNDPLEKEWIQIPEPTISNFYAGNMAYMASDANFFQAAVPHDGCVDIVRMDASTPFLQSLKAVTAVDNGQFFDMEAVKYAKVTAFRLTPRGKVGYISVDGEKKPFEAFQVEVHRGLGTVISKSRARYQSESLGFDPRARKSASLES